MTTIESLLKKNRFSKKVIYRIEDPLLGWRNYEYIGRNKYGIIMRGNYKEEVLLDLFDSNLKVLII